MTAPDPLVCMDLLTAGQAPDCGESTSAHCSSCRGCPDACACPPLPEVGTQVMPKPGTDLKQVRHTVVATWDHRRDGHPDDHVIVVQPSNVVEYYAGCGHPINTEHGAYLGLDDIEILADQPRITFTAKEQTG
jgi:hypothetical protein